MMAKHIIAAGGGGYITGFGVADGEGGSKIFECDPPVTKCAYTYRYARRYISIASCADAALQEQWDAAAQVEHVGTNCAEGVEAHDWELISSGSVSGIPSYTECIFEAVVVSGDACIDAEEHCTKANDYMPEPPNKSVIDAAGCSCESTPFTLANDSQDYSENCCQDSYTFTLANDCQDFSPDSGCLTESGEGIGGEGNLWLSGNATLVGEGRFEYYLTITASYKSGDNWYPVTTGFGVQGVAAGSATITFNGSIFGNIGGPEWRNVKISGCEDTYAAKGCGSNAKITSLPSISIV